MRNSHCTSSPNCDVMTNCCVQTRHQHIIILCPHSRVDWITVVRDSFTSSYYLFTFVRDYFFIELCVLLFLAYFPYFEQDVLGKLIAYFPLILHGPHRKRSCCLATIRGLSPSRCLATILGIHRHTRGQQRDLISLLYFFQNRKVG
jgi:hypothetical protein